MNSVTFVSAILGCFLVIAGLVGFLNDDPLNYDNTRKSGCFFVVIGLAMLSWTIFELVV